MILKYNNSLYIILNMFCYAVIFEHGRNFVTVAPVVTKMKWTKIGLYHFEGLLKLSNKKETFSENDGHKGLPIFDILVKFCSPQIRFKTFQATLKSGSWEVRKFHGYCKAAKNHCLKLRPISTVRNLNLCSTFFLNVLCIVLIKSIKL